MPTMETLAAALEIALALEVGVRARVFAGKVRADGADAAANWLVNSLSRP
jgi:hypothetical protein